MDSVHGHYIPTRDVMDKTYPDEKQVRNSIFGQAKKKISFLNRSRYEERITYSGSTTNDRSPSTTLPISNFYPFSINKLTVNPTIQNPDISKYQLTYNCIITPRKTNENPFELKTGTTVEFSEISKFDVRAIELGFFPETDQIILYKVEDKFGKTSTKIGYTKKLTHSQYHKKEAYFQYKMIKGPIFNKSGSPSVEDIVQGQIGDCYFLAALGTITRNNPNFIKKELIINNTNGTVSVFFYKKDASNSFTKEEVVIEKSLPKNKIGGSILSNGAPWVGLVEKAYAVWNPGSNFSTIRGGQVYLALESLRGKPAKQIEIPNFTEERTTNPLSIGEYTSETVDFLDNSSLNDIFKSLGILETVNDHSSAYTHNDADVLLDKNIGSRDLFIYCQKKGLSNSKSNPLTENSPLIKSIFIKKEFEENIKTILKNYSKNPNYLFFGKPIKSIKIEDVTHKLLSEEFIKEVPLVRSSEVVLQLTPKIQNKERFYRLFELDIESQLKNFYLFNLNQDRTETISGILNQLTEITQIKENLIQELVYKGYIEKIQDANNHENFSYVATKKTTDYNTKFLDILENDLKNFNWKTTENISNSEIEENKKVLNLFLTFFENCRGVEQPLICLEKEFALPRINVPGYIKLQRDYIGLSKEDAIKWVSFVNSPSSIGKIKIHLTIGASSSKTDLVEREFYIDLLNSSPISNSGKETLKKNTHLFCNDSKRDDSKPKFRFSNPLSSQVIQRPSYTPDVRPKYTQTTFDLYMLIQKNLYLINGEGNSLSNRPFSISYMCATTKNWNHPDDNLESGKQENTTEIKGLAGGHAYEICGYKTNDSGKAFIRLRNPWGNHGVSYSNNFKNMGISKRGGEFFLEISDFHKYFDQIHIQSVADKDGVIDSGTFLL